MPRRAPVARRRGAGAAVLAACLLGGCTSEAAVEPYTVAPDAEQSCADLYEALPETLGGQERTPVVADRAAAWGDPPIVVRCGVEKPGALSATSQCADIDGVGWFPERDGSRYRFTTIGREFYVDVEVPDAYEPAADVLVDIAEPLKRLNPIVQDCV